MIKTWLSNLLLLSHLNEWKRHVLKAKMSSMQFFKNIRKDWLLSQDWLLLLSQVNIFCYCISKNMGDSRDSDCIITNVVSREECITDQLSKQPKIEINDDFSLILIPGDGTALLTALLRSLGYTSSRKFVSFYYFVYIQRRWNNRRRV